MYGCLKAAREGSGDPSFKRGGRIKGAYCMVIAVAVLVSGGAMHRSCALRSAVDRRTMHHMAGVLVVLFGSKLR